VAVDVVTADGELIQADTTRNTDLLWAARGAGPGFPGVVVAFHLQTRSLPPVVVESVELYPLDHYADVMSWLQRVHGTVSPDVEIVVLARTPPGPVPGHPGGHLLAVTGLALAETREEADQALAPLWTCPLTDQAYLRAVTEHPDLEPLTRRPPRPACGSASSRPRRCRTRPRTAISPPGSPRTGGRVVAGSGSR
jgi:hypothetical protein